MRHTRRGFTLIEILVVIGIILVLVGLLLAGYRHIQGTAARRETVAELHVCRGLLQDFEDHAGLAGIEALGPQLKDNDAPKTNPAIPGFPVFLDPAQSLNTLLNGKSTNLMVSSGSPGTPGNYWPCYFLPTQNSDIGFPAGASNNSDMGSGTPARYQCNAVIDTQNIMYLLSKIPSSRTTLQSLQSKRILELPPYLTPPQWQTVGGQPMPFPPVVLLDGWGNPIIFVPRGGMHVLIKNQSTGANDTYLVRSTGTTLVTGNDPPMTGQERPFWASAGQDGDFSQGADNVYSFQD